MLVDVNELWIETFGFSRAEAVGSTMIDLGLCRDTDESVRLFSLLQEKGALYEIEITCYRTKKHPSAIMLGNFEIIELGGEKYVFASTLDITERKQTEMALQEKTHLLQTISDNMLDLVTLTDMEGTIKFLGASHDILGYGLETLIGKNVLDFVHPDDFPAITKVFAESIRNRDDTPKVEYRYRCADGSYFWFESVGRFIWDDNGEPKEIVFGTRNITERKQSRRRSISLMKCLSSRLLNGPNLPSPGRGSFRRWQWN
jgi:PAS domain S-box-containing protein